MLSERVKKDLEKKHYKVFKHSGVQVCEWNKKSLREEGVCYKEKFYGVNCHRCMQFSPSVAFCTLRCLFCWCHNEIYLPDFPEEFSDPEEILTTLIKKRKELLSGFGGSVKNRKKLEEAMEPNHFAISLSGEPTNYPKISELIDFVSKRARTVFLVTNGTNPEQLEKIKPLKNFQLYLSMSTPNEKIFNELCKPVKKDAWKNLMKTLDIIKNFDGRKVIRITIVKGINDSEEHLEDYANLIERGNPDFLEVKSFMSLGEAKKRLGDEKMPEFEEIKEFAMKLSEKINYGHSDESEISRIVLLKSKNSKHINKFE